MENLKSILQSLTKTQDEIYAKIGIFTKVTENTTDGKPYLCDVTLLDGSELHKVRLSVNPTAGVISVPELNSYVIVSFLNREEAFIAMIANVDYTVIETKNSAGEVSQVVIKNEGDKIAFEIIGVDNFNVTTKNGSSINIIKESGNDTFVISNTDKIRLGVKNGSEITIKEDGIDIATSNKVRIGNDTITLKTILDEMINTILDPTFLISDTGLYLGTLNVTAIATLQSLLTRIDSLLE